MLSASGWKVPLIGLWVGVSGGGAFAAFATVPLASGWVATPSWARFCRCAGPLEAKALAMHNTQGVGAVGLLTARAVSFEY